MMGIPSPRARAMFWAAGLLRHAWVPFVLAIVGRWAGSMVQITAAAFLAFALANSNTASVENYALLPSAITAWLMSTSHPSLFAALAALGAGAVSGILDTGVAWCSSWMHTLLNRSLTPMAVACALQGFEGATPTIDSSTLIQRWLLKEVLVDFFHTGAATGIGATGTIALVLGATFRTNIQAFEVCLVSLLCWSLCCFVVIRKAITASREAAVQHEAMGRVLRSSVGLRKDLSRPSAWDFWLRRTAPGIEELGRSILRQGTWTSILSGTLGIMASSIPLISLIAAVGNGRLHMAVPVYFLTSRLVSPLTEIGQGLTVFQDQLIAIQRMHDAFASSIDFQKAAMHVPRHFTRLDFTGGDLKFSGSGESIRLPEVLSIVGRLTYLIGPSGSGKSTLLAVLAGQRVDSSGDLYIDGEPVDLCSSNWREYVALLPQHPELVPGSVNDNLKLFPNWSPSPRVLQATDALLRTLTECRAPEVEFSAGQRRAVGLLRVLGSNVPIVLLDEPIAGIDSVLIKHLRPAIVEAVAHRIVIISMHEHDVARLDLPASVVNLTCPTAEVD